jgi:D-glycero-alpha-D-manno-heptose-7-phosphate kinase
VTVSARAWCRVDLAGGTLDLWPLGVLHAGARTVNVAVDLPVTVELEPRTAGYRVEQEDEVVEADSAAALAASPATDLVGEILSHLESPPVRVRIESGSPRGAGLGASSALAVALIAAVETLDGRERSTPARAAALARDLEARLMGLPTGRQDHFPAILGGALDIRHEPGGEVVRPLEVDLDALGRSLVVAFTGRSHFSAGSNWEIVRRRLDGDPDSRRLFDGLCEVATRLIVALETDDLPEVGRQMACEWSLRRQLAAEISTPEIESLLRAATAAGAWGGKATGAGGGGCLAVLVPPERRGDVERILEAGGGRVLAARPVGRPLKVESRATQAPC